MTANQSFQLKTSLGSPRFFKRKILTGFLAPPAMMGRSGKNLPGPRERYEKEEMMGRK
jgi:hypothetical protein